MLVTVSLFPQAVKRFSKEIRMLHHVYDLGGARRGRRRDTNGFRMPIDGHFLLLSESWWERTDYIERSWLVGPAGVMNGSEGSQAVAGLRVKGDGIEGADVWGSFGP